MDAVGRELVGGPNASYADAVRVVYHSVELASDPAPRDTIVMIAYGSLSVDRERLRTEVEQLVQVPADTETGLANEMFLSEERYSRTNWGASGAVLAITIWASLAAGGGILGGAAWDGLKAILSRLRRPDLSPSTARALDERRAQKDATQMALAAFPDLGAHQALTVLSCTLADGQATVVLRAADGSTIVVAHLTPADNGAMATITRAYPELPAG